MITNEYLSPPLISGKCRAATLNVNHFEDSSLASLLPKKLQAFVVTLLKV